MNATYFNPLKKGNDPKAQHASALNQKVDAEYKKGLKLESIFKPGETKLIKEQNQAYFGDPSNKKVKEQQKTTKI